MSPQPRIARTVLRSVRQERPGDSEKHLALIRKMPCCRPGCGSEGSDPHHLQRGVDGLPKGTGRTHADRWAIPLCRQHHNGGPDVGNDYVHWRGNDEAVLTAWGIDGRQLAEALWACRLKPDPLSSMQRVVYRAKQRG